MAQRRSYEQTTQKQYTVPVAHFIPPKTVDHEGSGVLLTYGTRHFVGTAAHVLDDGGYHHALVGGSEKVLVIHRPIQATKLPPELPRDQDPVDFGYVELSVAEASQMTDRCKFYPININERYPSEEEIAAGGHMYRIEGYPARDNPSDMDRAAIAANMLQIELEEYPEYLGHLSDKKDNRNWFIALRYNPQDLDGSIPSFAGFSGGSIWRWGANGYSEFAGIIIEAHWIKKRRQAVIVGLRSQAVRDLIRRWMKDHEQPE